MVTKVFNFQPVLFHQYYLCHLLWFKKQSFTLVWKPNPPLLSRLRAPCVALHMKRSRWKCFSSCDQWNLTPATMCCGSATRRSRRVGAADHAFAQVRPRQFFLLGGGGGVVRLTAKPRYLLLLHRGNKKSNTVTALRLCVVALDALTPASVHSLWSSPKFLNQCCLTILIRLRFSRLVVHLFLPHFFLPLNFLLTCLDTALCEQLLWQWMFVAYPPCEGCQWLSSGQLSDQQSSPWLCSLVNQTERPFWRLRKPLLVFWVD